MSEGGGILSGVPPLTESFSLFLVQATIIIALTHTLSLLGPPLRQPRVIFETIGGILLGPSALVRIPGFSETIFPSLSLATLDIVANFGLTLYLFVVGMELDNRLLLSYVKKASIISFCGIALPFCLGIAVSILLYEYLLTADEKGSFTTFAVFIGTAMSITAFPVLARVLKESGLIYTKSGAMCMCAAAIEDYVAWCLLILSLSMAHSADMLTAFYVFLSVAAVALGLFLIVRPVFSYAVTAIEQWAAAQKMQGNHTAANMVHDYLFAFAVCLVLMTAFTTALLGVHASKHTVQGINNF